LRTVDMCVQGVALGISSHGGINIFQRFDKRCSSSLQGEWIWALSSGTSQIWQCTHCGREEPSRAEVLLYQINPSLMMPHPLRDL